MPEIKDFTVVARDIQPGDCLSSFGGRKVVRVDRKTKYARVAFEDAPGAARPWSVALTEEVEVSREVPTEAERAAKEREMYRQAAEWERDRVERARAKAADRLATDVANGVVEHWSIKPAMETAAASRIWAMVDMVLRNGGEDVDVLDAVETVARDLARKLLRSEYRARSTSMVANAQELIEGEAAAEFVQRWGKRLGLPVGFEF